MRAAPPSMGDRWTYLNSDERALAKLMNLQKFSQGEIAKTLRKERLLRGGAKMGPTVSAVSRLLSGETHRYDKAKRRGRGKKTSDAEHKRMEKTLIKERASTDVEVPVRVVLNKTKGDDGLPLSTKISDRTGRRRLNDLEYFWLAPRAKPEQTEGDRVKRSAFGKRWRRCAKARFGSEFAYVDLKTWAPYTTVAGRAFSQSSRVKRIWRKRKTGDSLNTKGGVTKPGYKHRRGASGKSRCYFTLICNGKIEVFHHVKTRWNTERWLELLRGPVKEAMTRCGAKYLLRDGDPNAFDTHLGKAEEAKMPWTTIQIPPRSPDLNPCDYALWAAIKKKLLVHEVEQLKGQGEKVAVWWARLERTALELEDAVVRKLCLGMKRRIEEVATNGGGWVKRD